MSVDLGKNRERFVQQRTTRNANVQRALLAAQAAARATAGIPVTGSRAFDVVTGEEVEVVGSTRENVVVPAAAGTNR